jgi:hypothetical protein
VRHDTTYVGVQSKFKEWREGNKLTDYLPDEYQYPGNEADECVSNSQMLLASLSRHRKMRSARTSCWCGRITMTLAAG